MNGWMDEVREGVVDEYMDELDEGRGLDEYMDGWDEGRDGG